MARRPPSTRFDWRGFLILCAIYLALAFLWHTPWVYPLKLFVVLLHEMSHGIAALVTGGHIDFIRVLPDQEGGVTQTTGGNAIVITSAGYLGSMFFGAAILVGSARTRFSPAIALVLGLGVAAIAVFAMPREGRLFAAICGLVLASLSPLHPAVSEFVLRVIGVTSCLYAILDIKSDVLDRPHAASDAKVLEGLTHVPAVVWGALWIVVSLVVTLLAAKWAVTGSRPRQVQSPRR